jgi:hypothetical protein
VGPAAVNIDVDIDAEGFSRDWDNGDSRGLDISDDSGSDVEDEEDWMYLDNVT